MVLIFTLLSLGCWVILNRYTENWKSCEFFLLPSPNHDPYGYSPVIVKFGVWKSVSCSDWDNSEMSFTFQSYPARNSWSLPSAGLFPAVTLGLLCPLSLPCFPHSLTSLSWEHFLISCRELLGEYGKAFLKISATWSWTFFPLIHIIVVFIKAPCVWESAMAISQLAGQS